MRTANEQHPNGSVPQPARFGVEEEFLLVDAASRLVVPRATAVLDRACAQLGERVSKEITLMHVEAKTAPRESLARLHDDLVQGRAVLDGCARAEGARLVATGTPVLGDVVPPSIVEGDRPARGTAAFRALHDELTICALHVHIEQPDRERALLVSNHLRSYLPVLLALSANSPYWAGKDTGYASWRTMTWTRWPVAGPPPYFHSLAHYKELVAAMLGTGAIIDTGTIFWDVRPSEHLPTLEIRVADVPTTAQESALIAALVRALVAHVGVAVDRGDPGPEIAPELLRLAYWRAARDGLSGEGIDLASGQLVPAVDQVRRLFAEVAPILADYGDLEVASGWLAGLLATGCGADRQRASAARRGELTDVVDHLIAGTTSPTYPDN